MQPAVVVAPPAGTLESRYDAAFTAKMALREKQVQQSYRPIIGIHKWFARRPGSLFRSLLLAEFADGDVADEYWRSQKLSGVIADPFMGGGTTIFEALRLGLNVVGSDVNPMSYWLVRQGVEPLDIAAFTAAGEAIWQRVDAEIGDLYRTSCTTCGSPAEVKYFLWAKTCRCPHCAQETALLPGLRIAEAVRHPRSVYHCPKCEALTEIDPGHEPTCASCDRDLAAGNVRRGKATCWHCSEGFAFAEHLAAPPEHRLIGIEYRCPSCYDRQAGRQFKAPADEDLVRVDRAAVVLSERRDQLMIPNAEIPTGDETNRLHRWGYHRYHEMFSDRQLLALGLLLTEIEAMPGRRIRHALATVFSDFLRYQNLLCRYDTYALKCQDIFSVHGFPVGLIACENNVLGIPRIGSGSFIHFVAKFAKAKEYAQRPFETERNGARKRVVPIEGESIEAELVDAEPSADLPAAWLSCGPSQHLDLRPGSLDGVFTDPPYFDNVQYAELMDFCFVWLRQLLGDDVPEFVRASTRTEHELTGNDTLARGLEHFTEGVSKVFRRMSYAMKPGVPLVFTYHHNEAEAYLPLVVSILDAGLTCTEVLPAPGEMAASLHIAGTNSSILDSVFVCRDHAADGLDPGSSVDNLVERDRAAMLEAGYACTAGDLACLRAGHIAASAVRSLVDDWDLARPLDERITAARNAILACGTAR